MTSRQPDRCTPIRPMLTRSAVLCPRKKRSVSCSLSAERERQTQTRDRASIVQQVGEPPPGTSD